MYKRLRLAAFEGVENKRVMAFLLARKQRHRRKTIMARRDNGKKRRVSQEVRNEDPGYLRDLVEQVLQQVLDAEFAIHMGAGRHERTDARHGYRNGSYERDQVMPVGRLMLRLPRDRFSDRAQTKTRSGFVSQSA
jgi:transposase-like protein